MIRALEVYKLTGQPISHFQLQFDEALAADECKVFVLERSVEELHERINQRVEQMFRTGLIDEVRIYNKALSDEEIAAQYLQDLR